MIIYVHPKTAQTIRERCGGTLPPGVEETPPLTAAPFVEGTVEPGWRTVYPMPWSDAEAAAQADVVIKRAAEEETH